MDGRTHETVTSRNYAEAPEKVMDVFTTKQENKPTAKQ
jgi:hypothetical protein